MGLFRLVARVGCLRDGATRLLEEWPPIPSRGGQNPAYRPSGIDFVIAAPDLIRGKQSSSTMDCFVAMLLAMTGEGN